MRVAAFGDLHAHIYKEFNENSDNTGSTRLDNIINTLLYIRDYCEGNNILHVLFAGDLYHVRSRVNTIVYNSIYDCIKTFPEHGIEMTMIPGNHDDTDNSDLPQHSLHAFKDIEGVTVVDTLSTVNLGDGTPVVCARYSKNTKMIKDFINSFSEDDFDKKPILLAHLGVNGGLVGNGSFPMADAFEVNDLRPDLFKYVVLGHFHKRQMLGGTNNVFYCGAPIQHSFGDEGEDKGFYVLDTDKRYDIQFVPVPNPMFLTMTAYDVANEDMQKIADEGHYVRLMVKEGELQSALTYLPDNLKYRIVLEKSYKEQSRLDIKIGMTEEQVVTKYANEHNPEALELGLKILQEVKNNG